MDPHVMVDFIRWLKRRPPVKSDQSTVDPEATGYVYVGDGDSGPMAAAAPGHRVRCPGGGPPWIVVDRDYPSIVVHRWPGKLWRVRILTKATEQPLACATYTRASSVHVLSEEPLAALFGHNGKAVVELFDRVSQLRRWMIESLAASGDAEATGVYDAVWDRWLANVDPCSPDLGNRHAGLLRMNRDSPAGKAPSILHSVLWHLAREMDGDEAFISDEESLFFSARWSRVADCMQHTLFAIGVEEEFVDPSERAILRRSYDAAVLQC